MLSRPVPTSSCSTSEPLRNPLTLAGEVILELSAASSAADCDWTARLTEVDAAGRSVGLVDGIVRARYRHTGSAAARIAAQATDADPDAPGKRRGVAEPLTPGGRESYRLVLGSLAHVVPAGHRLRLQIASSNFPRFDRNPQSMVEPADAVAADFVVAEPDRLHRRGRHPPAPARPTPLSRRDRGLPGPRGPSWSMSGAARSLRAGQVFVTARRQPAGCSGAGTRSRSMPNS